MRKFTLSLSLFILAAIFFATPQASSAQVVHCYSSSLGCDVDLLQSNPSTCDACPDPTDIRTCCTSQPTTSCSSVTCSPEATTTPTVTPPVPPTATPPPAATATPPSAGCTPIGDPANCSSGAGCFQCEWDDAAGCVANISEGWMCGSNFGHSDSICAQFDNQSDCQGCGINILCQEENEAVGYRCIGGGNCHPCFQDDVDNGTAGCNPPAYSTIAACDPACTGQVPTLFTCIDGQCVESQTGTSFAQCNENCTDVPNPLGQGGCDDEDLYTAIGCIPITGGDELIGFILGWAIGIAGGVALLLIVYAGVQIMTSAGNPQKIQAGKELLTAAIAGFIFLLFSVFLLEFIGVDLLQIVGF